MNEVKHGAKRRTIIRVLQSKIDEWMSTLPEDLRNAVKDKILVTGGSIVSLLMGDPINDYDIYLRDREAAFLLADYYVKSYVERRKAANKPLYPMPYARFYDAKHSNFWRGAGAPRTEEAFLREHYNRNGINPHETDVRVGIFVKSAGAVGDDEDASVDEHEYHFFEMDPGSATSAEEYVEQLQAGITAGVRDPLGQDDAKKYRAVFMSQNAITLSDKIQIVLRFTGDAEEIHKNFDYVHATCSYSTWDKQLLLPGRALEAMLARELVYTGSLYPICSLFRMRKFIQRGWRITAGQITKMAFQIAELDLTNLDVLREQLTGVDAAYFHELIRIIRTDRDAGKPIDSTYIMNLIEALT